MIKVIITYSDKKQIEKIGDTSKYTPIFQFIDSMTRTGKKEAWKLKSYYGAKLDPFAVILDNDKPIKAFYSETKKDIIEEILQYLRNYENNS